MLMFGKFNCPAEMDFNVNWQYFAKETPIKFRSYLKNNTSLYTQNLYNLQLTVHLAVQFRCMSDSDWNILNEKLA